MAEINGLVTGVSGVRLAADAVLDLWDHGAAARRRQKAAPAASCSPPRTHVSGWFSRFADSLSGRQGVPEPLAHDELATGRLVAAVDEDLRDEGGRATATGVRVIWTGDHLDNVRRLQETLVGPARAAVAEHALGDR